MKRKCILLSDLKFSYIHIYYLHKPEYISIMSEFVLFKASCDKYQGYGKVTLHFKKYSKFSK